MAERLAGAERAVGGQPFVTRRVVRAPRDLVYRVWTELAHLQQWFGPKGCTLTDCTLDLRPGGVFHYCMRFGAHGEMWGKWVFREVSRDRLVFVSSFSDPQGNVVRAPFSADWPLETLSTVTFDEHAGIGKGTVVTVTATPIAATPTEQAKFDAFHDSMHQGWGGTFDQLEAHLARAGG
ncbi:MAG: SRPBCC domain-containing protein [Planctomycetes bacterium]|nr:SRPBCC domain-containing protein [Planctomycetota bacterium]